MGASSITPIPAPAQSTPLISPKTAARPTSASSSESKMAQVILMDRCPTPKAASGFVCFTAPRHGVIRRLENCFRLCAFRVPTSPSSRSAAAIFARLMRPRLATRSATSSAPNNRLPAACFVSRPPFPASHPESCMSDRKPARRFRSRDWFDAPGREDMAALYLERLMNFGMTPKELRSGRPIIGIAQSGSDLSPCNRIHLELAKRVREGIRDAGGIALEFPTHPIQETCRRPTAAIDRNLSFMTLVEILHGYPIDAVVLTTGCDKTTPAALMAASAVDIPAIVLSSGPMLDGWHDGALAGSGTVIWRARRRLAAGEITKDEFMELACASAPSAGHCNTMGTASTMNAVAEALGMRSEEH